MGCPLIGQSHVDGGIIVGQAHNAETEPNEKDGEDIITYSAEDTARDASASNSGVEQIGFFPARCLLTWAISAPYDNILCERCWILPLTLDFQRARSEYLSRCHHPTYEPNPSMKKFLEHQSGIGGFTYFLKAIGNNDDMVFLDRGGGVSPHKVPFSNRAGTLLRWCSIRVFSD